VKFFAGTTETIARVRLLMDDALSPNTSGWAQIQVREPIPVIRGQHFILRLPSPAATIGGGIILDTAPGRKWKRRRDDVAARFERLTSGRPIDLVSECLIQARRPMNVSEILSCAGIDSQTLDLLLDNTNLNESDGWIIHDETLGNLRDKIIQLLSDFHKTHPLQVGMYVNSLQNRMRLDAKHFEVLVTILHEHEDVEITNERIHLPQFEVRFSKTQQTAIETLLHQFEVNPYTPPSVKEAIEMTGGDLLEALIEQGHLVQINVEVVLSSSTYFSWTDYAKSELSAGRSLKVATFRDQFQTTRKYALGFLEYLEAHQLTRRVGDEHVAGRGDWSRLATP
jgi:selenocysteine-specific elongation factor